jgi:hypothetical protein
VLLGKDCITCAYDITPVPHAKWTGWVHLGCAAIFLLALAYIAICEFTKTTEGTSLRKRKEQLTLWQKQLTLSQSANPDPKVLKEEKEAFHAEKESIRKKERENIFYKFCGWTIVVMLAALVPMFFGDKAEEFYTSHNIVFWAEAVCLWAFGSSWIVKGV